MSSSPSVSPFPTPFEIVEGTGNTRLLLICDHASAVIPAPLGDLGLAPDMRYAHVAWDIGAAAVTKALAARLACPAVLSGVSRLVVDCNRPLGHPQSMPDCSGGVPVPGNRHLDEAERAARAEAWFTPYHDAVDSQVARLRQGGAVPAVISIHSFTPVMEGFERPWHVGVLWNRDPRLAEPALQRLGGRGDLVVGDNQPYSGKTMNYSLDIHAGAAGLPHVSIELRQDTLTDSAAAERWVEVLLDALGPVLADSGLYRAREY